MSDLRLNVDVFPSCKQQKCDIHDVKNLDRHVFLSTLNVDLNIVDP